jgi:Concanavalin A-like lectin/glucanases superfamily
VGRLERRGVLRRSARQHGLFVPPIPFDADTLTLGADLDGGVIVAPLTGRLDDVRIYNRALSAAEIVTLATPPP